MHAVADLMGRGAVGGGVADEDQRVELGERSEQRGELKLGVFAGRIERGRAGVAEPGDVPGAHGKLPLMKVVQAVLIAERGDLGGRFVIAREYPDFVAARL